MMCSSDVFLLLVTIGHSCKNRLGDCDYSQKTPQEVILVSHRKADTLVLSLLSLLQLKHQRVRKKQFHLADTGSTPAHGTL